MTIIKYLIKPLELVLFLGVLAALVYFRSIIFHSNVNQYIDTALVSAEEMLEIEIPSHVNNDVELKPVAQVECETVEVDVVKSDDFSETEILVADDEKKDAVDELSLSDEGIEPEGEQVLINTLSDAVSVISEKVDSLFDMNKSEPIADSGLEGESTKPLIPSANKKDSNLTYPEDDAVQVPVAESPSVDTKQVLHTARKLFWNGNVQGSEKLYLELINLDKNDPDAYGELGNVYYTQGKWKQAGEAYYEAAIRLLEQNNNGQAIDRVSYLLMVIQGLDTESADKLKNKIAG